MLKFTSGRKLSSSPPNVLSLLDFCKGLAILWIALFHYQQTWFGWQGVHIFIVLSGFGLTYSCLAKNKNISWKHWFIRRAERILPAYWLVSFVGFLLLVSILIFTSENIVNAILKSIIRLILDITLLRNLSYKTIFNTPFVSQLPNDHLWYIPLIVGLYLIFPLLYTLISKYKTVKGCLLILLGAVATEFIYRAISIYWLDGNPIGYNKPFLGDLIVQLFEPLNRLPDSFLVPFQLQAPFGLFLSRIAEFTLGMVGAVAFVQNEQRFNNLFLSYQTGIAGGFIWLAGSALVFVGLLGWVVADFIIALGLVLWVVNLAWIFRQRFSFLFLKLSLLGSWSYYIFLTHRIPLRLLEDIEEKLVEDNILPLLITRIFVLGFAIVVTWVASWLLVKFDKSRFPKLIIQNTIAKVLQR